MPYVLAKFSKNGIVKLPPIILYNYIRNPKSTNYALTHEIANLGFCDRRCWLNFHPLSKVIDFVDEEFELLPSYREWSYYVNSPLGERPRHDYWHH